MAKYNEKELADTDVYKRQVCVIAWQNFAFPGQVKETGYATGERAQGIAKAEAIVFDQHLHGFQQCFKTCNTDMG